MENFFIHGNLINHVNFILYVNIKISQRHNYNLNM